MGGRIVLNITIVGIFAFTAVGQDYITVGNFQGGGWIPPVGWVGPPPDSWTPPPPPQVWQDVTVVAVNTDTTEQVNTVTVVGHDDSRPAGQQDDPHVERLHLGVGSGDRTGVTAGRCRSPASRPCPGVGPMCDAGQWMKTAAGILTPPGRHRAG